MNTEDRRVKRTRAGLANALVALSIEQGYEAVTIQAVTDRAGINYRTFFRHYDGKDALLVDVLEATLNDIQQILRPLASAGYQKDGFLALLRENGRRLFTYVADNKDLFIVFLQSGPAALDPIQTFAQAKIEMLIAALPESAVPRELIANHIVTSTFSFIQWWLDNDMAQTAEQMVSYATELILLPVQRMLLENNQ